MIRRIQMIFQDPAASLNERATVDLSSLKVFTTIIYSKTKKIEKEKVQKMIHEVGLLKEHLTLLSHEFSGGQRQRIGIARAL